MRSKRIAPSKPPRTERTGPTQSAISADGSTLILNEGKSLSVYDVRSGDGQIAAANVGANECLAISPDGKTVATCYALYDATNGKQLLQFGSSQGRGGDIAFSHDGRWIAVATCDDSETNGNRRRLIDTKLKQTFYHDGPTVRPSAVVPAPDRKSMAVACANNSVFIYDVTKFTRE